MCLLLHMHPHIQGSNLKKGGRKKKSEEYLINPSPAPRHPGHPERSAVRHRWGPTLAVPVQQPVLEPPGAGPIRVARGPLGNHTQDAAPVRQQQFRQPLASSAKLNPPVLFAAAAVIMMMLSVSIVQAPLIRKVI